jgi:hypothetical protein
MKSRYSILSTIWKALGASIIMASSPMAQGDYPGGGGTDRPGTGMPRSTPSVTEAPWDLSGVRFNANLLGPKGDILAPSEPGGAVSTRDARLRVDIAGIQLIDPAITHGIRTPGRGHLLYRVDGEPIVATTATDLAFRNLGAGPHTIDVMLVASDFAPLGPQQRIHVTGVDAATPRTESRNPKADASGVPKELRKARVNARLVSMDERSLMREAHVEAEITGLPAAGTSRMTKAPVVLYRLDDGPVIATSERKLSFHELDPGQHTVTVALETADGIALGPRQTLDFRIPDYGSAANY